MSYPLGIEDLNSPDELVTAIMTMRKKKPSIKMTWERYSTRLVGKRRYRRRADRRRHDRDEAQALYDKTVAALDDEARKARVL